MTHLITAKNRVPLLIAALAILISLSLTLIGCKGGMTDNTNASADVTSSKASDEAASPDGKIKIVASVFPAYDFARNIAGEKAEIYLLLKPGMESHTFEPTPRDMIRIKDCDIFIYAGGESDEWLESLLAAVDTKDKIIISMLDCCSAYEEELKEGMREGGVLSELTEGEEEEEEYDEHVWTSPKNAVLITKSIADAMCEADTADSDIFKKNCDDYVNKLCKLDEAYTATMNSVKNRTIVVADRFPFRYLCEEYDINYYAAFPGCSEDAEVTARSLIYLSDKVKEEELPCVFNIEFSNGKIADTICEVTGCSKKMLHSCHNLSSEELEAGEDYISLMYKNLDALAEAMN